MDKKIIGLAGAALVAGIGSASAGTVLQATSYAELLQPIQNAVELLKVVDAMPVEKAQFFFGFGDHHHHHSHHHNWHHHHGWDHHHHSHHHSHHHHSWHHHH
jgi:hypothetical protein